MNEPTRIIVRIDDDQTTTWCSRGHDLREIELEEKDGRLVGDCPACRRRYVSRIVRPFPKLS